MLYYARSVAEPSEEESVKNSLLPRWEPSPTIVTSDWARSCKDSDQVMGIRRFSTLEVAVDVPRRHPASHWMAILFGVD